MSDSEGQLAAPSQPSRNWYLTVLIVGSTLFAAGGVIRALFYGPVHARWLVAHAANELQAQRVDSAVSWLDKAYVASKDIASDQDYWRLRFEILAGTKPIPKAELDSFTSDAIQSINEDADPLYKARVAATLSRLLGNEAYFEQSLAILEATLPPVDQRTPSENNEIAYARALADSDLDLALVEINTALEDKKNKSYSQFFDTKAWVLYKKGDSEMALRFADAAVKEWYRELSRINPQFALVLMPDNKLPDLKEKNGKLIPLPSFERDKRDSQLMGKNDVPLGLKNDGTSVDPVTVIAPALANDPATNRGSTTSIEKSDDAKNADQLIRPFELPEGIGRDRGSPWFTTAVLRYHRACILDELNKHDLAQRDYLWLYKFGFTETTDLY